jgi:hypothetical protein
MDQVVTTLCFDGQFWVAFIEKTHEDGTISVGRHTFGAEPSNPEVVEFMLGLYALVPVYSSEVRVRVRARKSIREQERSTNKAKAAFKESQNAWLAERKTKTAEKEASGTRRYELRAEKKKEKRRGH